MDALVLPLGFILVGLVAAGLSVHTYSAVQQARHQRRHEELSLELMRRRIAAAKKERQASALAWNGYRKFVIDRKVEEGDGVCSYYLLPHDQKPLPVYQPGQYLTFRLSVPGREKPVVRCYSLSDAHRPHCYRITVKRVFAPREQPSVAPGLVSNYFHEQLAEGDILDVQAPRGNFVLDPDSQRPAVLIGGGVGVTPLISMIRGVAESKSARELLLLYGVRNRRQHAFRDEVAQIVARHANIRCVVCYSQPGKEDSVAEGLDYHHHGRITLELIKGYLQSTNYEFYLCGPPAMMKMLTAKLAKWGVAPQDIHTEAFGPATIVQAFQHAAPPAAAHTKKPEVRCQVTFAKSGKTCGWTASSGNLLELAQSNRVQIDSGCRAGNCGTCVVAIKSGRVTYLTKPGAELEQGTCLTCIAEPDGDITLDA